MWVKDKKDVEIDEKQRNYTKKMMISLFWNFYTLFFVEYVPIGETYNIEFVVNTLFLHLSAVSSSHRPKKWD